MGNDLQHAGSKIEDAGAKMSKLTAPLAAVGAAAVKMASDYDKSVAKVYTIMDKQAASTQAMSREILDLSTATGKSATELADAGQQSISQAQALKEKNADTVKVIDGPLEGFLGTVDELEADKDRVRVIVSMFGRETSVDLELDEVEVAG